MFFYSGLKIKAAFALAGLALSLCLITGCGCGGRAQNEPKYYKSELQAIKKAKRLKKQLEAERPTLKDNYPWQGKKSKSKSKADDPCGIVLSEQKLQAEIDFINKCVYGEKKTKLRD